MLLKLMEYYLNSRYLAAIPVFLLLLLGCKNNENLTETEKKEEVKYQMYQPSEMAVFMNAMYAYNLQLKTQISNGEVPDHMPLDLMRLHSAEMTDGKYRTETWKSFVNVFITAQEQVTDTTSSISIKERYNATINNCLGCHKTECVGPIPRIKKLLLQ